VGNFALEFILMAETELGAGGGAPCMATEVAHWRMKQNKILTLEFTIQGGKNLDLYKRIIKRKEHAHFSSSHEGRKHNNSGFGNVQL